MAGHTLDNSVLEDVCHESQRWHKYSWFQFTQQWFFQLATAIDHGRKIAIWCIVITFDVIREEDYFTLYFNGNGNENG